MKRSMLVAVLTGLFVVSLAEARTPPNIILVMVDDLGAMSLNSGRYKIPHLDRMAAQGMTFQNAFSMPLCGPTRATIMSGRYAFRSGVGNNQGPTGFTAPWGSKGTREVTFGNLLKGQGYATAIAGKWAMCKFDYSPNHVVECGFDNYRMWPKIYKDEMQPRYWGYVKYQDGTYSTAGQHEYGSDDEYKYLIDFIRKNKEKPFFAYWPMTLMHVPLAAPPGLRDAADKWVANVSYIDILMGRLMDEVDKLGLGEKTLILFTTDNGSAGGKHGAGKGKLDDRGTHVPLIARWKNTVKAGSVSEDLVDFTDFFATFADLAGAELPKDRVIDGRSFVPQLLGQKSDRRDSVYFQIGSGIKVRGHKYAVDQSGALYDLTDRYNYQLIPASSYTEDQKGVQQRLFKALEEIAGSGGANATSKDATSRYKGEPSPDAAAHPENVRAFKASRRKPARSRSPVNANLQSGLEDGTPHGRKREENLLLNGSFADGAPTKANAGFDSAATFDVPNWKDSPGGSYGKSVKSNGINKKAAGWFSFFKKGNAGAEQITGHSLAADEKLVLTFKYEAVTAQARGKESCLAELFYADNGASKTLVRSAFDTDAGPGTWILDRFLELDMKQFPEAVGKNVGVRIGFNPGSSCSGWIRVSNVALSSGASEPAKAQPSVSVSEPLSPKPEVEPPVSGLDEMQAKTGSSDYPNIVLIYADDLGYGDLSCYGATKVSTPNMDRLAKEGRLLTDGHSTSAVCTPSRYALLTGEYPLRINNYSPVFCEDSLLITPKKTTIASLLKHKGYATACVGKWHLGFGNERKPDWNQELKPGPLEVGFDYFFGLPVVNSHPPFVYMENRRIVGLDPSDPLIYKRGGKTHSRDGYQGKHATPPANMASLIGGKAAHELYVDEQVGEKLTQKALSWMNQQAQPFFLYYASHNVHLPITPHPYFHGKSECGLRGDFVQELDWSVGQLIAAVERFGVWENTLFVLTSDNGAIIKGGAQGAVLQDLGHTPNGNLKGMKFDAWEGGHRVPFIACWPGKIPAGTRSDAFIANLDLLPTFAAITDQELDPNDARDGFNQLPLFVDPEGVSARDELIIMPHRRSHTSLRQGDWVYIPRPGGGGFGKVITEGSAQLYNLKEDPFQNDNRIADSPERADAMATRLKKVLEERGMTADRVTAKKRSPKKKR